MAQKRKLSITALAGAVRPEDAEVGFRRVKVVAATGPARSTLLPTFQFTGPATPHR